jgi:ABC-type multidrug transport system ATPase subunit
VNLKGFKSFADSTVMEMEPGVTVVVGPNGSGKSTLLRIMAGMQSSSKGKVEYGGIEASKIFSHISFTAPGQEIIEELTLQEFLQFHFNFKKPINNLDIPSIIKMIGLESNANKPIGDYSSGMKQRVKLAQAIFSDTPILLLDEPCTNLDQQGVEQYRSWIEQYSANRLVIVASNDIREYFFCKEHLSIEDYK